MRQPRVSTLTIVGLLLSHVAGCTVTADRTDASDPSPDGGLDARADVGPWGARLGGTVWGPGHVFPVSGALVAFLDAPPAELPAGAYCERCIEVAPGEYSTTSRPDGTFTLELPPGASGWLVVQKGQFRLVTAYAAPGEIGDHVLDEALTTLPTRNDPASGRSIPHIALVYGDYDAIQDVLAKAGLSEQAGYGHVWGSEAGVFDVFDNHGAGGEPHGEPLSALLRDFDRLSSYHIVFFACSYNANFAFMDDPLIQSNLRDYVRSGGRLYVTDYAYRVVEMPWSEFIWFEDSLHGGCVESRTPDGCNHGPPFDSPSRSLDRGLSEWLLAIDDRATGTSPHAEFQTRENWDTIGAVMPGYAGDDPETGAPTTVTPTVWVEGPWSYLPEEAPSDWDRETHHPLTVTFPFGCGRVLYTTYHTVGGTTGGRHPGFDVQELVLWYLLMEIQVCSESELF